MSDDPHDYAARPDSRTVPAYGAMVLCNAAGCDVWCCDQSDRKCVIHSGASWARKARSTAGLTKLVAAQGPAGPTSVMVELLNFPDRRGVFPTYPFADPMES